jgi:hypothetical protein
MRVSGLAEYWDSTTQVTIGLDGQTSFKLLPRPEGSVKEDYPTEPVKLTLSIEDLAYLDAVDVPWLEAACSFSGGPKENERTGKVRAMVRGLFGPTPPAWLKVVTPVGSPIQAIAFGDLTNSTMALQPLQCPEIPVESPG